MKILIVDDNAADRKLLRQVLARRGCEVMEASNGEKALRMVRSNRPDVIVSEVFMSKMDGFQFLQQVKSDPALRALPFVIHSCVFAGSTDKELALFLGADGFIAKPEEPEKLWAELCAVWNGTCPLMSRPSVTSAGPAGEL